MKPCYVLFFLAATFLFCQNAVCAPKAGFHLPDSVNEMSVHYRSVRNLIVLPVVINDSIRVNLILDTACRNLVLFGKRFRKLIAHNPDRHVQFSGLGSGEPVKGFLALSNKVSIRQVLGESIPIVLVAEKGIFSAYHQIDGVIGYDIFLKFEIELNPALKLITFRPAATARTPTGFVQIPMQIVDSRPVMDSRISMDPLGARKYDLMIDTGSALGLLLKTTNIAEFPHQPRIQIGLGFNGPVLGFNTVAQQMTAGGFEFGLTHAGVIESAWHDVASIGMQVLKDYIIVLNYCKAYACFKKLKDTQA